MQKLTFRIIDEESISFKDKKLFVVKTNNNDQHYGIEVVNKVRGYGRVNSPSLGTSTEVFDMIVKRLQKITNYTSTVKYVKNLFSLKRMYLMRFAIQAENMKLSQADIITIARKNNCKFTVKYNQAGDTNKPGWKTIQVINREDKLVGEFVGKSFSNEMRFVADNKVDLNIVNSLIDFA